MKAMYFLTVLLTVLCLKTNAQTPMDTITMTLGEGKKVIIVIDDKSRLKELQEYDINEMISNLAAQVDTVEEDEKVVVITDKEGEKFDVRIIEVEETDEQVAVSIGNKKVVVIEDDERVQVKLNSKDNERRKKATRHYLDFDIGTNNYLNKDGKFPDEDNSQWAVRPWGSWNVAINSNYRTHLSGPLALQWGGGVSWYNFKFQDDATRLIEVEDGVEFYRENNPDINSEKSKLSVSYIQLQAVPMLDFRYTSGAYDEAYPGKHVYNPKAFRIGLGGYAAYRLGSHTKYKYDFDGDNEKDKDRDNFYLNNWRYGLRLQLGFKGIDLYANYDLNELFSAGRGPELNAFSFGIIL